MKKIKFIVIAGTRPNFIKIAPLFKELKKHKDIKSVLINTEQHYDFKMAQSFFADLGIPKPDYNLGVHSGTHGEQTAKAMVKIEQVFIKEKPDLAILVGDVNSTLAGALAAVKLHIKIAHIEAGQRSFDRQMPEEINRMIVDRISDIFLAATKKDVENLMHEGIERKRIFFTGNIMTDALFDTLATAKAREKEILKKIDVEPGNYALMTIHRANNTDVKKNLKDILLAAKEISKKIKIIFPVHPRCIKMIKKFHLENIIKNNPNLVVIPPVSYIEMAALLSQAKLVLTDSGGLQHETSVLNIPCLTIKKTTEWPITVEKGTNIVVGNDAKKIINEAFEIINGKGKKGGKIEKWDGKASQRIVKILKEKYNE